MSTDTELRELQDERDRLRLERAELADQNEALRSRIDRSEEIQSARLAEAVAAVTPCTCSAQRARAERAEAERDSRQEAWASALKQAHAAERRAEEAEAKVQRLREGIEALIAEPDDTQWWEVVPYMDPPERDEVVEVAVVATDRLRSLLQEGDHDASLAGREEQ